MDDAVPLHVQNIADERVKEIVQLAATNWLKTTDVLDILQNYQRYALPVCVKPPFRPPGTLYWV